MQQKAINAYQGTTFTAKLLRDQSMSLQEIADKLNENGYRTRQGKQFARMTVKRMLDRAA
jgi:hypothetical protein